MSARRDQFSTYSSAGRRTAAALLRSWRFPPGAGRDARWPWRAVLPGLAAGAVLLAGFAVWGMVRPGLPGDWDAPGAKLLVGSESTTRYVILRTGGRSELHPVLNLASARLLLDPARYGVLTVDESLLDDGRIPHGATLGIPYAPDRLPPAADAGTPKVWAVCEQPGGDATTVQKAAFVLGARDAHRVAGAGRLRAGRALHVQGPDGRHYLVDAAGTLLPIGAPGTDRGDDERLVRLLFGAAPPRRVTADWLATLHRGDPLVFPAPPGFGRPAAVPGLDRRLDRIGTVLGTADGHRYVVLTGRIAPVSDLVAELLLNSADAPPLYPGGAPAPQRVDAHTVTPAGAAYPGGSGWPSGVPRPVDGDAASTVCSVYRGTHGKHPDTAVWTGSRYPVPVVDGGTTAYVTPGSGLLYRQTGDGADPDALYLVTDTGLRYPVPAATTPGAARVRLGYARVVPVPVPVAWSGFLPAGPALDTAGAARPQGS